MLNNEEREFLEDVRKAVDKTIEKIFDKHGRDRAYYEFVLKVNTLDTNFKKESEVELINEEKNSYCIFCRKPSWFYVSGLDYPELGVEGCICAECFNKLKKEKK